ncbi:MAG: RagB/SusD family nutrient uptake outer membrane protein [Chitinophagaceae bacterium]|nr:RagB/SusD family nutrient uptake outer membrane protein [Chitinophagaceae bacterium]
MRIPVIFTISILAAFASCKKYVDIVPKGKIIPQETRDYRLLLNNTNKLLPGYGTQEVMTDNIDYSSDPGLEDILGFTTAAIFSFQDKIYQDNSDVSEWNNMYSEIYVANVVINEVMSSTGGSQQEKNYLLGEALTLRAHNYWALVNIWAKAYDAATAAADPGVPLVLQADLQANLVRKPVADVYAQIIKDLEQAASLLPATAANNYIPSKASAFAMLCRTRLMMRDYDNAEKMADSTLKYRNALFDLNTIAANPRSLPLYISHPEVIYLRQAGNAYATMFLSQDLLNLLGTQDLRRVLFTADGKTTLNYNGVTYYGEFIDFRTRNTGPTVPEIMLVKAECLARKNDKDGAVTLMNQIRQKRFKPLEYQAVAASDATQALNMVLDERRRELFCTTARFFDLKRLSKEPALAKTVTHLYKNTTYTLPPDSKLYVFPIPPRVLEIGPGIVPNER